MNLVFLILALYHVDQLVLVSTSVVLLLLLHGWSMWTLVALGVLMVFPRHALLLWLLFYVTYLLTMTSSLVLAWVWIEVLVLIVFLLVVLNAPSNYSGVWIYVLYNGLLFVLGTVAVVMEYPLLLTTLLLLKGYLFLLLGVVLALYVSLTSTQLMLLTLSNAVVFIVLVSQLPLLVTDTMLLSTWMALYASVSTLAALMLVWTSLDLRLILLSSSVWSFGILGLGITLQSSPWMLGWFGLYLLSTCLLLYLSSSQTSQSSYNVALLAPYQASNVLLTVSPSPLLLSVVLLAMPLSSLGVYKLAASASSLMVSGTLMMGMGVGYIGVLVLLLRMVLRLAGSSTIDVKVNRQRALVVSLWLVALGITSLMWF